MRGVLNVDKPSGITSFDCIRRLRAVLRPDRPALGHAGTLDPMASGVLLVLFGPATRASRWLMGSDKEYEALVQFGARTDTDDVTGTVVEERPAPGLDRAELAALLAGFTGEIEQVPPRFTALKQGGVAQHRLARAGRPVQPKPRTVAVREIELLDWQPPRLRLRCRVSSGFYVRSLARDIGSRAGSCATLAGLVRTASGRFRLADAVALDNLDRAGIEHALVPVEDALAGLARVEVAPELARDLLQGRHIPAPAGTPGGAVLCLNRELDFLGVCDCRDDALHPKRLIHGN